MRFRLDDYTPYIYKTEDYGKTWKLITKGIDPMHFTRVVRADRRRPGLLYAGTEYGMYISFDDGEHWLPFQLNLPVVPVTDLTIKDNDLLICDPGPGLLGAGRSEPAAAIVCRMPFNPISMYLR
jgi:hypothetical protein